MPRKGKELEQLVAILESQLGDTAVGVRSPDSIRGKHSGDVREVDVTLRTEAGSARILAIFECRDRKDIQGVEWIEQLASKKEDVGADKAVAVFSTHFSEAAKRSAHAKGIELRTLAEVESADVFQWLGLREAIFVRTHFEFVNTSISLDAEQVKEIPGTLGSIGVHEKAFRSTKDRRALSIMEILSSSGVSGKVMDALKLGDPPRIIELHVSIPSGEKGLEIRIEDSFFPLVRIDAVVKAHLESTSVPISSLQRYRREDKDIAELVGFDFEQGDKRFRLSVNYYPEKKGYGVSLNQAPQVDNKKQKQQSGQ